jgi:hypothetical protein
MKPATSRHLRSAGASTSVSISAALSGCASVGKPAAGIAIYQLPEANALEAGIVVDDAIVTFEQKAARILPAGIGYESTARSYQEKCQRAPFARDCGIFGDARFHLHRRAVHSVVLRAVAAPLRAACGAENAARRLA